MIICSFDTLFFNIKKWYVIYLIKKCNKCHKHYTNIHTRKIITDIVIWDHSFSTYKKFSEVLTFLTPWYWHERFWLAFRLFHNLCMSKCVQSKHSWPLTVKGILSISYPLHTRKLTPRAQKRYKRVFFKFSSSGNFKVISGFSKKFKQVH